MFHFRLAFLVDIEGKDGDKDCGYSLDGDLDVQRIKELPEKPLFLPGLFSDPSHDPLFEEGRRFHLSETLDEILRLLQVR